VVKNTFDDAGHDRIRYSPYTTWVLQIHPEYQLVEGGAIYNQALDWTQFDGVELVYSAFFNDRSQ